MMHEELTERILRTCFAVSNELGCGFLESVYQKALLIALQQEGLKAEAQKPLRVSFRGKSVGEFYADLVVEDVVLVELKAAKAIASEHCAQVLNYLKASGIVVGLLVNFGTPKAEVRRFNNHF
jgi:GxxExxY protein